MFFGHLVVAALSRSIWLQLLPRLGKFSLALSEDVAMWNVNKDGMRVFDFSLGNAISPMPKPKPKVSASWGLSLGLFSLLSISQMEEECTFIMK